MHIDTLLQAPKQLLPHCKYWLKHIISKMEQNNCCQNLCLCGNCIVGTSQPLHAFLLSIIITAKLVIFNLTWLGSFNFLIFHNILHLTELPLMLHMRKESMKTNYSEMRLLYTPLPHLSYEISLVNQSEKGNFHSSLKWKSAFFPNSAQKTNNYILDCLYLLNDWAVQVDRNEQIN